MDIEFLKEEAVAYLSAHGGAMVSAQNPALFTHAPLSLFPSPFPRNLFDFSIEIAPIFNKLVDRISREHIGSTEFSWICRTLKGTIKSDLFTRSLVELFIKSEEFRQKPELFQGNYQSLALGILRSDYMIHDDTSNDEEPALLQVELNTIAASFGCLSGRIAETHKYIVKSFPAKMQSVIAQVSSRKNPAIPTPDTLPENHPAGGLAKSLYLAQEAFKNKLGLKEGSYKFDVGVLFVVQEGEKNSFDQRMLQYELFESYQVKALRMSMTSLLEPGNGSYKTVNGVENVLVVDGMVISVVYFRAGYTPNDFPTDKEWKAREFLEFSYAVKCPNIAYHLSGTKKVQQALARPGEVERFLSPEESSLLRKCFAGLWSLDEQEQTEIDKSSEAAATDLKTCGEYVLKPQREGGGNNFYGEQIPKKFSEMSSDDKAGYILMQRIFPVSQTVRLLRNQEIKIGEGISELGVFGTIVSDDNNVLLNEYCGYLLRTKFESTNEGGVATGYSCLSSIFLTN